MRSPVVIGIEHYRVKDLWDDNTRDWRRSLIHQLFNNEEAALITSMARFQVTEDDQLTWWRSRSGCYSVQSAYYTITEELFDSSHLRVPGPWMSIWKLQVPRKIKFFLWRAARGCLPTGNNLLFCHVMCEKYCPMCEENPENE